MRIAQNLELDMVRLFDEAFDVDRSVAERGHRLGACRHESLADLVLGPCQTHSLAAAALRRFQHDRKADAAAGLDGFVGSGQVLLRARNDRNAGLDHFPAGRDLVSHRVDRFGPGADEHESRLGAPACEVGVLRQKSVAGMHGVRSAGQGHADDPVDVQVALFRGGSADAISLVGEHHMPRQPVGFREQRHRADTHLATRANHAHRDFSPVGNHDFFYHNNKFGSTCPSVAGAGPPERKAAAGIESARGATSVRFGSRSVPSPYSAGRCDLPVRPFLFRFSVVTTLSDQSPFSSLLQKTDLTFGLPFVART